MCSCVQNPAPPVRCNRGGVLDKDNTKCGFGSIHTQPVSSQSQFKCGCVGLDGPKAIIMGAFPAAVLQLSAGIREAQPDSLGIQAAGISVLTEGAGGLRLDL